MEFVIEKVYEFSCKLMILERNFTHYILEMTCVRKRAIYFHVFHTFVNKTQSKSTKTRKKE